LKWERLWLLNREPSGGVKSCFSIQPGVRENPGRAKEKSNAIADRCLAIAFFLNEKC
jgi:hypothetical protein